MSGISDGDEGTQTISISASSSDLSVVSGVSVDYTSPNAVATLNYNIVGSAGTSAIITIKLQDDGGLDNGGVDTNIVTFTVSVNANNAPTIDAVSNISRGLSEGAQTLSLAGITDGDNGSQSITVNAVSSATAIVSDVSVIYTSPNNTATLNYNAIGSVGESATITITVQDDGGTASGGIDLVTEDILVTIYANVNNTPTINNVSKVSVFEDAGAKTVNLSGITDGDDNSQTLTITAVSSNTSLIVNPVVTYTGGTTASLAYTPAANLSGTTTITLTVQDDGGDGSNNGDQSKSIDFEIEVIAINDQPTIDAVANQNPIAVSSSQQIIALTGLDDGDADFTQTLSLLATASVSGIVTIDSINETAIYYTPLGDGTTTITIILQDNGGISNGGVNSTSISFDVVIIANVGINNVSDAKMILYPNPTSDFINVSLSGGNLSQIRITDITGKTALLIDAQTESTTSIDVSSLKQGIYLMFVKNNDGVYKAKFIKE